MEDCVIKSKQSAVIVGFNKYFVEKLPENAKNDRLDTQLESVHKYLQEQKTIDDDKIKRMSELYDEICKAHEDAPPKKPTTQPERLKKN